MPKSWLRCSTNMSNSSKEFFVQQERDAFARRQLALGVLGWRCASHRRPRSSLGATLVEFFEDFLHASVSSPLSRTALVGERRNYRKFSQAYREFSLSQYGARTVTHARYEPTDIIETMSVIRIV